MMQNDWADEVMRFQGQVPPARDVFNLFLPSSHCTTCKTSLGASELVPVLSFLWLKARCRHCQASVSWRYPLVELAVAAWWAWSAAQGGVSGASLAWAGFGTVLLALAFIDADTMLLPDVLTQPLMWSGLILSAWGLTGLSLSDSLWGAVAGYVCLWLVHAVFKMITGKQGMGEGDFKLLAALGAWLGWMALPVLLLIASLLGVIVALLMRWRGSLQAGEPLPFGPYLVFAGMLCAMADFTP
jgi:leader peptidase (prepilin peptidase)/N-methyltransferase